MTVKQLFTFLGTLFETKSKFGDEEIKARLVWRDADGNVTDIQYASIDFSSGLRPELNIAMSTASRDNLRPDDAAIVRASLKRNQNA